MTYINRQVGAITQMQTFKVVWIEPSITAERFRTRQLLDTEICDVCTLDETYAFQLGEGRQVNHGVVRKVCTACQINVPNSVAVLH